MTDRWRSLYVTAGLGMLILAGMMTAATFFRIVHFDHARLLLRHGQLEMARALDARYTALKSSYGNPESLSQELLAARLCDERHDDTTDEKHEARDLYFEPYFGTRYLADYPEASELCGTLDIDRFEKDRKVRGGFDRSADVHNLLAEYMPFYDRVSVDTRLLYEHRAADNRWSWWRVPRGERTDLGGTHPFYLEFAARDAASAGGATYHLVSNSPALSWPRSAVWWLAVLASIFGVLAALRFVVQRVFLLDVEIPDPVEPDRLFRDGASIHMLLLCPPLSDQAGLMRTAGVDSAEILDARQLLEEEGLPEPEPAGEEDRIPLFVIEPGSVLSSRDSNGRLLAWLEGALATQGRVVVMACGRRAEAAHFLPETPAETSKDTEEDDGPPDPRADPLFDRWNNVLSRFSRLQTQVRSDPSHFQTQSTEDLERLTRRLGSGSEALLQASRLQKFGALLRAECIVNPRLQEIGLRILRLPSIERRTRSEVLEAVRLAADGYYRALWNTFSEAEKLTVAQLAHGRLVNYKASGAFRTLAQKRIVVRNPGPELMNKSFTLWVRDEAQPEKVVQWEGAPGPSIWQQLKTPFYLGVLGSAAFLFLTQRALFQSTLAFASAMTAALPLVFRMIDRMQTSPKRES